MPVTKKSSKKLLKKVESILGNSVELSNGNLIDLSLKKGMIEPSGSIVIPTVMTEPVDSDPVNGIPAGLVSNFSYLDSSSLNTNETHHWISPNFKKLWSFDLRLNSVAPQVVNTRALRFNFIVDGSDTDNFVVFNDNKKWKGDKYSDDNRLSLESGNSTFIFNTNGADINIKDRSLGPGFETNSTIFLGQETKASIEWFDPMGSNDDRKVIVVYGFDDDDFIDTRYITSFQNSLDYKIEQEGEDVVIKYKNILSKDADDDSLYSVLRIKSIDLGEIEDQISELPDGYNLDPEDDVQNNESEIMEPDTQGLDHDAILLTVPDVFVKIDSFDPINGKIYVYKSQFDLPTDDDPVINFARSKKKALKLAETNADFVYVEKKGLLYFNENESVQGWGAGGEILELTEKPKLTSDNFQFFDF